MQSLAAKTTVLVAAAGFIGVASFFVLALQAGVPLLAWAALAVGPALTVWLVLRMRTFSALALQYEAQIAQLKNALESESAARHNAEVALTKSESRSDTIMDSIQTGIIITDPQTLLILDANPMACTMIGAPPETIVGSPVSQFISGRDEENERLERAERILQPVGKRKPCAIMITVRPVTLADKVVLLESFVDINERKEVEMELCRHREHLEDLVRERTSELSQANAALKNEIAERLRTEGQLKQAISELQRSNKELETFAYVASHDLQEPLRLVATHTQLLMLRYYEKFDAEAEPITNCIIEGVNRMRSLIQDLLTYSRVGARSNEVADTDCQAVFDRVLTSLAVAIAESGAVIEHGPLPIIRADPMRMEQLLQNLVGNGVKFRREHPARVTVTARKTEDAAAWLFCVEDNGIGIEPEYFERIFIIFQRLHSRRQYKGTGIGLAICKRIVERHGGQIWVESQVARGSRFYFTIPVKAENHPL